jgi:type IV pilus assembly protein PilF
MKSSRPLLGLLLSILAACSAPAKKDANEPSASDIYVQKGIRYMEENRLDVALEDLKRAVELDGANSNAYNALAVLYERLDKPGEADAAYRKALSIDEENFGTHNNYGRFLCGRGEYDKAMEHLGKIVDSKLYQTPWVALTNAGLCARASGKREPAEEYLRRALEKNPTFPPALLEMAKISLESGQYLSARAFLQRYEATAQRDAVSLWLGVQIEHALGNRQAASDYHDTLLGRFPDSREAMQARKLKNY